LAPGHSIKLTVKPQFAVACFGWAVQLPNLPFSGGRSETPSNTMHH